MKTKKTWIKWTAIVLCALIIFGCAGVLILNACVKRSAKGRILTPEQAASLEQVDCILILGCGVYENGQPSAMLRDRLIQGISLYKSGVAPKLLMSGDHGQTDYDEVNVMKQYAIDAGVPSEDIFMDHAGFSTYESVYRAREIFGVDNLVIVTQEYHLYRAIYTARQFGMEVHGVSADLDTYAGQFVRDAREILARCKDFAMCIFKPKPTHLGDAIPISGNGDITND